MVFQTFYFILLEKRRQYFMPIYVVPYHTNIIITLCDTIFVEARSLCIVAQH